MGALALLAAGVAPGMAGAQDLPAKDPNIVVNGEMPAVDPATLPAGPEIHGVIAAHKAGRIKVNATDGSSPVIAVMPGTRVRASGGLFGAGHATQTAASLLNGLPVTVKTAQGEGMLVAREITFKAGDLKTATMIRNGTAEQFAEQSAATEALRGRMADIDKYNVKTTTNVFFDTGKWALSPRAKADLCTTATQAEATENALMLVVGYTDSVGSDDYNQTLSEKRAGAVINYLQQVCHWKPYRMLTPTGMAKADPLASNDTPEGKAQNRRVSVNVLVSKSVDGM